jgi:hypothetical protein
MLSWNKIFIIFKNNLNFFSVFSVGLMVDGWGVPEISTCLRYS